MTAVHMVASPQDPCKARSSFSSTQALLCTARMCSQGPSCPPQERTMVVHTVALETPAEPGAGGFSTAGRHGAPGAGETGRFPPIQAARCPPKADGQSRSALKGSALASPQPQLGSLVEEAGAVGAPTPGHQPAQPCHQSTGGWKRGLMGIAPYTQHQLLLHLQQAPHPHAHAHAHRRRQVRLGAAEAGAPGRHSPCSGSGPCAGPAPCPGPGAAAAAGSGIPPRRRACSLRSRGAAHVMPGLARSKAERIRINPVLPRGRSSGGGGAARHLPCAGGG